MTLLEMKKQVLKLIEEINPKSELLTDDPDIANKINDVINQIQNELARIKEFGRLSMNSMEANDLIWDIQEAYHITEDIDDDSERTGL